MKEQSGRQISGAEAKNPVLFPNRLNAIPAFSDVSLERLFGVKASLHMVRPEGSLLFAEGQKALGVYVVWDGRVKISIGSGHGKSLILGLAGRGTVLGLPAALLGRSYAATAEVVKSANVSFVSRADLLRQLRVTDKAAYAAAEMVSAISYSILDGIKIIHLSHSAEQKVARFLLRLHPTRKGSRNEFQLRLEESQEEIGQMIGLSRETVARVISRLKKRHILDLRTPVLVVHDRAALANLAEFPQGQENDRAEA